MLNNIIILAIRTDKPEAEVGCFKGKTKLEYCKWQAHRKLAETIHTKIDELLESQHLSLKDMGAIVAYKGPGSFTGLRIGISVANTLADSLKIPIVSASGDGWIESAFTELAQGKDERVVLPEYGALPRITEQKK